MSCTCDIKALVSVGCKCGGFAAEQAAKSNGSSALAAPAHRPWGIPESKQAPIPSSFSSAQDQILVVGKNSGSEYWVKMSDWRSTSSTLGGIVHKGMAQMTGLEGKIQKFLWRSVLKEATPQLQRAIPPTRTAELIP